MTSVIKGLINGITEKTLNTGASVSTKEIVVYLDKTIPDNNNYYLQSKNHTYATIKIAPDVTTDHPTIKIDGLKIGTFLKTNYTNYNIYITNKFNDHDLPENSILISKENDVRGKNTLRSMYLYKLVIVDNKIADLEPILLMINTADKNVEQDPFTISHVTIMPTTQTTPPTQTGGHDEKHESAHIYTNRFFINNIKSDEYIFENNKEHCEIKKLALESLQELFPQVTVVSVASGTGDDIRSSSNNSSSSTNSKNEVDQSNIQVSTQKTSQKVNGLISRESTLDTPRTANSNIIVLPQISKNSDTVDPNQQQSLSTNSKLAPTRSPPPKPTPTPNSKK